VDDGVCDGCDDGVAVGRRVFLSALQMVRRLVEPTAACWVDLTENPKARPTAFGQALQKVS
jgi:hypothetical protein